MQKLCCFGRQIDCTIAKPRLAWWAFQQHCARLSKSYTKSYSIWAAACDSAQRGEARCRGAPAATPAPARRRRRRRHSRLHPLAAAGLPKPLRGCPALLVTAGILEVAGRGRGGGGGGEGVPVSLLAKSHRSQIPPCQQHSLEGREGEGRGAAQMGARRRLPLCVLQRRRCHRRSARRACPPAPQAASDGLVSPPAPAHPALLSLAVSFWIGLVSSQEQRGRLPGDHAAGRPAPPDLVPRGARV